MRPYCVPFTQRYILLLGCRQWGQQPKAQTQTPKHYKSRISRIYSRLAYAPPPRHTHSPTHPHPHPYTCYSRHILRPITSDSHM